MMRVGTGFDVHRLIEGRKLVLGGVEIDNGMGLDGHSDADVLTHAIMDALLGSLALGDIGKHFPDTAPEYEGADSIELLKEVGKMVESHEGTITNIDATVLAESPKLAPYIDAMQANLADALGLPAERLSVKATTLEQMGFLGRGEGIGAMAAVGVEVAE